MIKKLLTLIIVINMAIIPYWMANQKAITIIDNNDKVEEIKQEKVNTPITINKITDFNNFTKRQWIKYAFSQENLMNQTSKPLLLYNIIIWSCSFVAWVFSNIVKFLCALNTDTTKYCYKIYIFKYKLKENNNINITKTNYYILMTLKVLSQNIIYIPIYIVGIIHKIMKNKLKITNQSFDQLLKHLSTKNIQDQTKEIDQLLNQQIKFSIFIIFIRFVIYFIYFAMILWLLKFILQKTLKSLSKNQINGFLIFNGFIFSLFLFSINSIQAIRNDYKYMKSEFDKRIQ